MKRVFFCIAIFIVVTKLMAQADKNFLLGKTDYTTDKRFVKVEATYCTKEMYLEARTYQAFKELYKAAQKDGIALKIVSGARNFEYQKQIWENKWKNLSKLTNIQKTLHILKFSAMPGTSRHHWGTDIDLLDLNNSFFEKGHGLIVYQWLSKNAQKFGFCQVYTDKVATNRTGYELEKWHWSYLPAANEYLKAYKEQIQYSDIQGFSGASEAESLKIIENYVQGVYLCW